MDQKSLSFFYKASESSTLTQSFKETFLSKHYVNSKQCLKTIKIFIKNTIKYKTFFQTSNQ